MSKVKGWLRSMELRSSSDPMEVGVTTMDGRRVPLRARTRAVVVLEVEVDSAEMTGPLGMGGEIAIDFEPEKHAPAKAPDALEALKAKPLKEHVAEIRRKSKPEPRLTDRPSVLPPDQW